MPDDEKENYCINPFNDFIPQAFISKHEGWDFFSYRRNYLKNHSLWLDFMNIEQFYRRNKFRYKVTNDDSGLTFTEYFNNDKIRNIRLNNPVYYDILVETENKIESFVSLFHKLLLKYPDLTESELTEYLKEFKSNYIIYCNDDFSSIISVISLDKNT